MEPLDQLRTATAYFDRILADVTTDQWTGPTPCEAWTVRALIDHVTGGNRWAVALLGGASAGDALVAALEPGFGDDLLTDYRRAADSQLAAFAEPDALDRTCHHFVGDVRGRTFLLMRTTDVAVHGWDLARATGGDEHLDDDLVAAIWADRQGRMEAIAGGGLFGDGPSGTVGEDAPIQIRLLDLLGRRP